MVIYNVSGILLLEYSCCSEMQDLCFMCVYILQETAYKKLNSQMTKIKIFQYSENITQETVHLFPPGGGG